MQFKGSWHSRSGDDGKLRTVGLLIVGPKGIKFRSLPEFTGIETSINEHLAAALEEIAPGDVFTYYVDSGNGITNDWSVPFQLEGADMDTAAAKALAAAHRVTSS